ncbi:MAG TPA: XRE family transcriptional regulator [Bacteroidales bacterium]|nr:XRE family transcriptional regulator [Bacteroidales bacterium]
MKDIFSKRLKSARIRAGLSMDQLVERMGNTVSKNAISKYEQGEMMADSKVMASLAKALDVKFDYFFRPFSIEIGQIDFRKKSRLSKKDLASIRQQATDTIERYIELEQFLNIQTDFVNPLQDVVIKSSEEVELAAEQLLYEWHLSFNGLPNVIDMLEDHEIKVIEIAAHEAFDGLSGWADGRYPVVVVNNNYPADRKRLTALHELGHLLLSFDPKFTPRDIEHLCFQFAGAMLLPRTTFKKELGEIRSQFSIPEYRLYKATYGISVQALMARAKLLEVISESSYLRFRKWISHNRKEEGLGTYSGTEEALRFKQLTYRAAAEEIISLSKAANIMNQKLAEFRKEFLAL